MYTPGVYLHRGVYCAYERGFSLRCSPLQQVAKFRFTLKRFLVIKTINGAL